MSETIKSPFELLPTASLGPRGHWRQFAQQSSLNERRIGSGGGANETPRGQTGDYDEEEYEEQPTTYLSSIPPPPLDEATGLRILRYIHSKKGSLVTGAAESDQGTRGRKERTHKPTFSIQSRNNKKSALTNNNSSATVEKAPLLAQFLEFCGVPSKDNIKYITKATLLHNDITVAILIRDCEVDITEMRKARILYDFADLIDLGFATTDLTIDEERFSVNKLVQLYGAKYSTLRNHPAVLFSLVDLLQCKFSAGDLMALEFNFDAFFEGNPRAIEKEQLLKLDYSLKDLMRLGFTKEHMDLMKISEREALRVFKWRAKHYERLVPTKK